MPTTTPKPPAHRPDRHQNHDPGQVAPVVLPHVVITVTEPDTLSVTLDGTSFCPPEGQVWGRGDFAAILDDLTEQRRVPVRVDVYESDGSHFTDIIGAHRPRRTPTPELKEPAAAGEEAATDTPAQLANELGRLVGFLPGETVVIAEITEEVVADENGTITPPDTSTGPVVIAGRTSGTLVVQEVS